MLNRSVVVTAMIVAVLAVTASIGGCSANVPPPASSPPPTPDPVFASDEEALAAARDAYEAYLAMSGEIGRDGGANPERIARFVTEQQLKSELSGFAAVEDAGIHGIGISKLGDTTLQAVSRDASGAASIVFYGCVDSSDVRVIDESGADVTPLTRIDRQTFEIRALAVSESKVLFDGEKSWPGGTLC